MAKDRYTPVIILLLIILLIIIIFFLFLNYNKPELNDFASCAAAGYPVMESYPRQCSANGKTFVEIIDDRNFCTTESRFAEACITLYDPVCGYFDETIQCIKAPCAGTYSNSCVACLDKKVSYWVSGECPMY